MVIHSVPMDKEKAKKTKIIVKAPTQERSRQTVATILEACSRLLIQEGFYSITTDKIAKEAGVSIGSLYQFFGNKESVVQAVVKNLIEEDKKFISEKMRSISPLPVETRIPAMVALGVELYRKNSELRSKLTTVQYYVADAAYISDSIKFFQDVVKYNIPEVQGRNIEKMSYVFVNAFMGLANTMSIDKPDYIHNADVASEIAELFCTYLGGPKNTEASPAKASKGDYI